MGSVGFLSWVIRRLGSLEISSHHPSTIFRSYGAGRGTEYTEGGCFFDLARDAAKSKLPVRLRRTDGSFNSDSFTYEALFRISAIFYLAALSKTLLMPSLPVASREPLLEGPWPGPLASWPPSFLACDPPCYELCASLCPPVCRFLRGIGLTLPAP